MNKSRLSGPLLLAVACALVSPAAQPDEWRTYHHERYGYELQYPAGWTVVEARTRSGGALHRAGEMLSPGVFHKVTFREPAGKVWPGEFVVLVREHVNGRSLDEWADANFTDVHDETLVSSAEDTTVGGRTARLFTIFGFDHTGIVVAFVRDGKIYEIGYTGANPNDPDRAEHRWIYERMKRSFKLVPSI
jgi:hypothetical protein